MKVKFENSLRVLVLDAETKKDAEVIGQIEQALTDTHVDFRTGHDLNDATYVNVTLQRAPGTEAENATKKPVE